MKQPITMWEGILDSTREPASTDVLSASSLCVCTALIIAEFITAEELEQLQVRWLMSWK